MRKDFFIDFMMTVCLVSIMFGIVLSAVAPAAHADGLIITPIKPPNRNGNEAGDNTHCPPGPDENTKGIPDAKLGDKDVSGHNDGTLDFFMGGWKFVLGDNDVIVTKWAINQPPTDTGQFRDYFSLQINISVISKNTETTQVQAGPDHICPYFGGVNLMSGFETESDQNALKNANGGAGALPTRIDDISWNKLGLAPTNQEAQKTIYSQKADGSFSDGEIIKFTDGSFTFTGEFKVGNNFKEAADLTADDKKQLQDDFNAELKADQDLYSLVTPADKQVDSSYLAAGFVFTPSSPVVGQTVNFDGSSSSNTYGGNITGYSWAFGDGGTGSGSPLLSHVYDAAGTYAANLTVTDDSGDMVMTSNILTVTLPVSGGVGGNVVPVDKLALFGVLLAPYVPYVGLASAAIVATAVATAIYVKRVKRKQEKQ